MPDYRALTIGAVGGLLVGGALYAATFVGRGSMVIMGTDFHKIPKCADVEDERGIKLKKPTVAYKLVIEQGLDVKALKRKVSRKKANNAGDDEDPADPGNDADEASAPEPTRWDIALNLKAPTVMDPKIDTVVIKIVSNDPNVLIRQDQFAVRGGDDNGSAMLCGLKWGNGTARFKAFYYDGPGPDPTFGSFNIGVFVKEPSTNYVTPIFIDPNIKNHG
jgi:hypothetical protein